MRYFFSKQNIDPTNKMKKYIDLEINKKIFDIKTFLNFRDNCNKICSELFEFILNKKNEGKSIAGYGATAPLMYVILGRCNSSSVFISINS